MESQLDLAGDSRLQAAETTHVPGMPEVEASYQLEDYRIKSIDWPFSYLTAGTRDSVKLRGQDTLLPTKERELLERILREKL